MWKKTLAMVLTISLLFGVYSPSLSAADTISTKAKMDEYVNYLASYGTPHWNAGIRSANSTELFKQAIDRKDYGYGLTYERCLGSNEPKKIGPHLHQTLANGNIGCTSNIFACAAQCHGFALYMCYVLYRSYPQSTKEYTSEVSSGQKSDGWTYYKYGISYPGLQVGDMIHYDGVKAGKHSAIVYSVSSDGIITVVDCNVISDPCVVQKHDLWLDNNTKLNETTFKSYYNNGNAYICRYGKYLPSSTTSSSSDATIKSCSTFTTRYNAEPNGSYTLYGMASASSTIAECGMYIGTSENNLTKLGSDKINTNKTDMWYNTTKYGYKLEPGTTYYYQAYAILAGSTTPNKGEVKSFVTSGNTVTGSISLNRTVLTINADERIQLTATTVPANQPVTWTSSDPSVATVENGVIVALKQGTTVITATMTYGNNTAVEWCSVTVTEKVQPKISLNSTSLSIKNTECIQLTATTTPPNQAVVWSSSDTSVATVDGGSVVAKKAGTAVITAVMAYEGKSYSASCTIKVEANGPQVSVVTGNASDITATSAVLHGSGSCNGANITGCGMYIGTSTGSLTKLGSDSINTTKTDMWYSTAKYGYTLSAATTYYYQAYIVVDGQLYWGDVESFRTTEGLPPVSVITGEAGDITASSAVLYGSGSSSGANITGCGMYIGTSTGSLIKLGSDSINTPKTDMWYSTAKYGYTLSPGTTYYYQAYIVVDGQLYWGDVRSFTTPAAAQNTSTRIGIVTGTGGNDLAINDRPAASPANSNMIGRIPPRGQVIVYPEKTSGNWYWVEYNGVQGYAYKAYITLQ